MKYGFLVLLGIRACTLVFATQMELHLCRIGYGSTVNCQTLCTDPMFQKHLAGFLRSRERCLHVREGEAATSVPLLPVM